MPDALHIGFGVDRHYVAAMAITILSILDKNPGHKFVFHVAVENLPDADIQKLDQLAARHNTTIKIHVLEPKLFAVIPDKKSATYAIYYRLFLCDLLKNQIDKILYMDSDIVCLRALPDLPHMGEAVAGVVLDAEQQDRNAGLNRSASVPYFNSGVMYIDLKNWQANDVTSRVVALLSSNAAYRFPDQDALNLVLENKLVWLDAGWNRMWEAHQADAAQAANTTFLHYAGQKPWYPWSKAFLDAPFAQYLDQSPWPRDYLMQPRTRKQKGQYARYLFKERRIISAIYWYAQFALSRKPKGNYQPPPSVRNI